MEKLSNVYKFCADDGKQCNITQPSSVAYKPDNSTAPVIYRNADKSFTCKNPEENGGPVKCYTTVIPSVKYQDGVPVDYIKCSDQNSICEPNNNNEPANILYGSDGKYNYVSAYEVECDNQTLGDPNPNVAKKCYWSKVPTKPPTPQIPPKIPPVPIPYQNAELDQIDRSVVYSHTLLYVLIALVCLGIVFLIAILGDTHDANYQILDILKNVKKNE